jgi:GTP-binding protein HflX
LTGLRAAVIEVQLPDVPSRIDEVVAMARSVGYEVVDQIVQKRNSADHSFTIGRGKLLELKQTVEERHIAILIFTNTLTSAHVFNIQQKIGNDVKVIDRNLLILDLFRKRAMTSEAKLQIQLAHLKYTFSWGRQFLRMTGILGEQVGWSGPGEYPFRDYEKAARRRISAIQEKLEKIHQKKDILRKRRRELGYPIVALAGYTQSGKTTFFNLVTQESKTTGLGPFTTLSTYARKVAGNVQESRFEFILVDSIGFIDDMHKTIVDAFNATLSEIANAEVIVLFLDASEDLKTLQRKISASNKILRQIGASGSIIIAANKIDLVSTEDLQKVVKVIGIHFPGVDVVSISARNGKNVDELTRHIAKKLNPKEKPSTVKVQSATERPRSLADVKASFQI